MKVPFLRHRGPTHTTWFAIVVVALLVVGGVALGVVGGNLVGGMILGLTLGGVGAIAGGSHLLADMLTPAGVDLWGTGEPVSYNIANASNPVANYVLLGLGIGAVGLSLVVGSALPF